MISRYGTICTGEDRPTEPPEDVVCGYCDVCRGEIYEGEALYRIDGNTVHEECLGEFAKDYFANYKEEI